MAQYIELTRGKRAFVDDCYYEELNKWKWRAMRTHRSWYAVRTYWDKDEKRYYTILMHQEVLRLAGIDSWQQIDHKDCDGLNNQQLNLRPATIAQDLLNQRTPTNNTSGYKGVSYNRRTQKWTAAISINGIRHRYLGGHEFLRAEDAARAYDAAALKYHGEFARLNFPETEESAA